MFNSLYFKDTIQAQVDICVDDRYEGSGVNDRTFGTMFYLKQMSKAADDLYNKLREKLQVEASSDKKVVASDKYFSITAQTRAGNSKIDKDLMHAELCSILRYLTDSSGSYRYTNVQAHAEAAKIIAGCTVFGKDSTVISVVENADAR